MFLRFTHIQKTELKKKLEIKKPRDSDANGLSTSGFLPHLSLSLSALREPCSLFRTPLMPLCFHTVTPSSCSLIWILGLLSTLSLEEKPCCSSWTGRGASPLPHLFLLSHLLSFSSKATNLSFSPSPQHGVGDFSLHPINRVISSTGFGGRKNDFESRLCYSLAMWPWISYLTSLRSGSASVKWELQWCPPLRAPRRMKWANAQHRFQSPVMLLLTHF